MNILIQLSHPAHFHLYKLVAKNLKEHGHNVSILIKSKDILEELLQDAGLEFHNINEHAHRNSKWGILWDMLVREWRIIQLCRKYKIDLLTGSTPEVAHVSWLMRKCGVNTGEDDLAVVPMFEKIAGPFIQCFVAPVVCDGGRVSKRTIHYPSYHELAYLHPNHFQADKEMVRAYGIDTDKPYFIMRFSSLNAHHDKGIKGINTEIAQHLVDILAPHGRIYITSERHLEPQFEQYRIQINPLDMHHVMAFASLYIGDSQTMAAEAGVLGVPFVRFNDFVGRIGYLRELEDVYHLGYGIRASDTPILYKADGTEQPHGEQALYKAVEELVALTANERQRLYGERRQKMLSDKIDYAKFLTWFIENYPKSVEESKGKDAHNEFWKQFK
jgi:predicted glycosyltransferase